MSIASELLCRKEPTPELCDQIRSAFLRIAGAVELIDPVLDSMCDNRGLASSIRTIGEAIRAFASDGEKALTPLECAFEERKV